MAYVAKTLMIGRCRRCGKRVYKGDDYLFCENCKLILCIECNKEARGICPACQSELKLM